MPLLYPRAPRGVYRQFGPIAPASKSAQAARGKAAYSRGGFRTAEKGGSVQEKARAICLEKHAGQLDRGGQPYYLHPFAVADGVQGDLAKTIAYLHDVVEDTDATLEWLADQGFPPEVVDAVDAMTRRDGEEYFAYIERLRENELAIPVKLADLRHNMDPSRKGATSAMHERYRKAYEMLGGK